MKTVSTISLTVFLFSLFGFSSIAKAEDDNEINTSTMTIDFYGAEYLENYDGIVVIGHNGLVGTLKVDGGLGPITIEALKDVKLERARCYRVKYYCDLVSRKPDLPPLLFHFHRIY